MLPSNLISYIYSESGIARLVSYRIKSEGVNSLRVTVQQPQHLDELNKMYPIEEIDEYTETDTQNATPAQSWQKSNPLTQSYR